MVDSRLAKSENISEYAYCMGDPEMSGEMHPEDIQIENVVGNIVRNFKLYISGRVYTSIEDVILAIVCCHVSVLFCGVCWLVVVLLLFLLVGVLI